jgi:hypothetical protein
MTKRRIHGIEAAGAGSIENVSAFELLGPCPSCGADLHVGNADIPRTGRPARALMHAMPFCTYYGETPADVIERDVQNARKMN